MFSSSDDFIHGSLAVVVCLCSSRLVVFSIVVWWRCSVRGLHGFVESAAARLAVLSFNQPVGSDSSGFLATMELPKLCWKPRREAR